MSPEHEKIILEKLEWVLAEDRAPINERYSSVFYKINELLIELLPDSYKHKILVQIVTKIGGIVIVPHVAAKAI